MGATESSKGKPRKPGMSDQTKKIVLASAAGILVVVGGWWAYFNFTTIKPPDPKSAPPEKMAAYLGAANGFARMPVMQREQYLKDMWAQNEKGENRERLAQAFERMSPSEKQVFVDATFDAAKVTFGQQATEFSKLPKSRRNDFLDSALKNMESQRMSVLGPPGSGQSNVARAFEGAMPTTTDGMTKTLVERTSARERARCQPYFDALAARSRELAQQRRK